MRTIKLNEQKKIIVREMNNNLNLKPTENFSKSSFRLNNQSDPGARTCVSKEADCCVAPAHPPLPSGETTCPLGFIHKSVSAHRGATHVTGSTSKLPK